MSAAAHAVADTLALWRNPAFIRFRRSRLRLRKAAFWCLLTVIVASFVVSLTYIVSTNSGTPSELAARRLFLPLLIIQGLILMMKGTGSVSAGLIQDKMDQTLDYQRLTPLSPLRNLLGYLFGLPALEYAMFALTLPHLAFVVVVGRVPALTVLAVYTVFFVCAVLYHLTGIAAGMVMRKWIWGYMLSIFLVLIVNVILPTLVSQAGLKFLQYLSMWPVIGQKVLPLAVEPGAAAGVASVFAFADAVPFYRWQLSPFTFTLLLQGALIATLGVMALRRWQSATRHSLSKPYALGFLGAFVVLVLGNVWPAVTGSHMPFPLFGERNLDSLREVIAIGLPLVYGLVTWLLCFLLFAIVIPSRQHYVRGMRRAAKHGRRAPRPWEDDAASFAFMGLFVLVALAGLGVLYRELDAAGFFGFLGEAPRELWRLPLACALVLGYTALVLQVLGLRATTLVVLLIGLLPILTATVLSAAANAVGTVPALITAVSPLAYLVASGFMPVWTLAEQIGETGASLAIVANFGLAFLGLQIAFLAWRWRRIADRWTTAGGSRDAGDD